jgi:hypothetical protein
MLSLVVANPTDMAEKRRIFFYIFIINRLIVVFYIYSLSHKNVLRILLFSLPEFNSIRGRIDPAY